MSRVACVALALLASAPAGAQTNLGFEQPLATGWAVRGGTARLDSLVAAEGAHAARLDVDGENGSLVQQVAAASLTPGATRVRLRGLVRTEALDGGASLWLRVDGPDGPLAFDNRWRERLAGTTAWTPAEITLVLPPEATRVAFGALAMGTGTAWADSLSLTALAPDGPASPEASAYLATVLDLARTRALRRDSVDWPRVAASAEALNRGSRTTADTYPVVNYVLTALGDRHSLLEEPTAAAAMDDVDPETVDWPAGRTARLPGGQAVGQIWMPGFTGGGAAGQTYADTLQATIRRLDAEAPCGYVLDLRDNSGGNVFPMLAGIRPVLGEAFAGAYAEPGSDVVQTRFDEPGNPYAVVPSRPVRLRAPDPPVAVLTGPTTASSGEAVAVAFRGRPRTRSFGAPTEGLSTNNEDIALSDGAVLFLATSVYVDRDGTRYGGALVPDEPVPGAPTETDDPALDAAMAWLATVCRP